MKLNQLLARAEHTGKQFKALLEDYISTFKSKQSIFQGKKQQYQAAPEQDDMPNLRGNKAVQSTVREYLAWFVETTKEFVNYRFSVEATNAMGPKGELIVDGKSWGSFSSVELMRLNDFLNSQELLKMYQGLPVRSDTTSWLKSVDPEYATRDVWETEEREGQNKTTIKSSRILNDPNLVNLKGNQTYIPQVVPDDKTIILGSARTQEFSGELSHREKAEILRRLTLLKACVKEALVLANEAPVIESGITANMIFDYIHIGTI